MKKEGEAEHGESLKGMIRTLSQILLYNLFEILI